MKKIYLIFTLIIISSFFSCRLLRKSSTKQTYNIEFQNNKIEFNDIKWVGDTIGKSFYAKTGFYIPVKMDGIKPMLYMQFDLGIPTTRIYENTLLALVSKNQEFIKLHQINEKAKKVKNISLKLGNYISMKADELALLKNFGDKIVDSSFIVIGSIGFDFIYNQVLILDFKNDKIALAKDIESLGYSKINFVEGADAKYFPIRLPFVFNNKKIKLCYDTGSSMFTFITGTKLVKGIISSDIKIDTICCLNSWGKQYPYYKAVKAGDLKLNSIDFGTVDIYGFDALNKLKYFKNYIFGITGNILFDKSILVIDRQNNKFGIIK